MGARGNSGVITSQIFRGMAEGIAGKSRFNGLDLAHALSQGAKTAYGAVAKPVEGTILTVIREAAEAAVAKAEDTNDIEAVLAATVEAAEKSVARTPSLLPILREAGVVDSGGQGLLRLFQGALHHIRGRAPAKAPTGAGRAAASAGSTLAARIDEGFGYETMFLLQAHPGKPLDVDAIRDHLESIGESVLVAGDARALKVHVHNERPDEVIGFGLGLGSMSKISVENLDNQARDVQEARATEFTGVVGGARRAGRRDVDERRLARTRRSGRARRSSPSSPATASRRSTRSSASTRSSTAASRTTRAPGSCSGSPASPAPARSCCCPTTRTSASPPSRRRRSARTSASSSSRRATPRRASPRSSRSTRRSTPPPTPAR